MGSTPLYNGSTPPDGGGEGGKPEGGKDAALGEPSGDPLAQISSRDGGMPGDARRTKPKRAQVPGKLTAERQEKAILPCSRGKAMEERGTIPLPNGEARRSL